MSTDKTLKYIGTISYKDLHNQEIISKYDDKTGKKMLYASTNKDRDMSDITKENPICFGYGIHWWVTMYCEDNQIHCEYHISLMQQMYVAYNNIINGVIEALNTYYPAIKNRYKTFGFTIAEVPVEM